MRLPPAVYLGWPAPALFSAERPYVNDIVLNAHLAFPFRFRIAERGCFHSEFQARQAWTEAALLEGGDIRCLPSLSVYPVAKEARPHRFLGGDSRFNLFETALARNPDVECSHVHLPLR